MTLAQTAQLGVFSGGGGGTFQANHQKPSDKDFGPLGYKLISWKLCNCCAKRLPVQDGLPAD